MNIKNIEVERLVGEIAERTGETKTQAIRRALEERRGRLTSAAREGDRGERVRRFLATEVWPRLPRKLLGRRLTRRREDAILGYGPDGV